MNSPVKNKEIGLISYSEDWQDDKYINMIFEPLKGKVKRDWLGHHAYHCTPLVMGNQHGFLVKSLYNFSAIWNGGDEQNDVTIKINKSDQSFYDDHKHLQSIEAHFGMGTFTTQTAFTIRTPENVNLMTIPPPNILKDGVLFMSAVIETDNLRRDFTFNSRLTRKSFRVKFSKGDALGCFMPYPRYFIDEFNLVNASDTIPPSRIKKERKCMYDHGIARSEEDIYKPHGIGKLYKEGKDIYGNQFTNHQTKLHGKKK